MNARLTTHQAEVLSRIVRHTRRIGGPVPESTVGSRSACAHLIRKGYLTATEIVGPRGGVQFDYFPTPGGFTAGDAENARQKARQDARRAEYAARGVTP